MHLHVDALDQLSDVLDTKQQHGILAARPLGQVPADHDPRRKLVGYLAKISGLAEAEALEVRRCHPPRYWGHRIRGEEDYHRYSDYIHPNPVKHEYVDRSEDWPRSTFDRHVKMGWIDAKWPGASAIALPDVEESW